MEKILLKTNTEKSDRNRPHFEEYVAQKRKAFNKVDLPPYSNMCLGYSL